MTNLVYIKISVIAASNKQINAISNQNYVIFSVLTADNMVNFTYTSACKCATRDSSEKGLHIKMFRTVCSDAHILTWKH